MNRLLVLGILIFTALPLIANAKYIEVDGDRGNIGKNCVYEIETVSHSSTRFYIKVTVDLKVAGSSDLTGTNASFFIPTTQYPLVEGAKFTVGEVKYRYSKGVLRMKGYSSENFAKTRMQIKVDPKLKSLKNFQYSSRGVLFLALMRDQFNCK